MYLCVYWSIHFHQFTVLLNKIIAVLMRTELIIQQFSLVKKSRERQNLLSFKAARLEC